MISSKLAIGLVIGASVKGAISGIKEVTAAFKSLKDNTLSLEQKTNSMFNLAKGSFKAAFTSVTGLGSSIMALSQPAIAFESAMADVKKVVDFKTPEGFANLSQDILNLTRILPMTAEELAAITASGGQLGIAEEDLKDFTTTIAKMSVAFDMSAEDSGDAMAKLANVYKIPIKEIEKLGDAINELSNSSPAKASDIVSTLGRIGGVAKQFGLTENAAAALSSSFISLGKAPEVAGTAINGMLTKLMTADKGGKKFQNALKSMGLNAKDLKNSIGQDAEGALTDFLKKIQKLPKEKQMGVLVDLFGLDYADDVAVLAGNVEVLENSLKTLQDTDSNGKAKYLGSMEKEFAARAATTENSLKLLKNSFMEVGVTLGSSLLPIINNFVQGLMPMVHWVSDLISNNQELVASLLKVGIGAIAGFSGLSFVIGIFSTITGTFLKLKSGAGFVSKAFSFIKPFVSGFGSTLLNIVKIIALSLLPIFDKLVTILGVVKTAIFSMGRALLTNPLGLTITAITVAAYLIYDNWEPISAWFSNLWTKVTGYFQNFCNWVQGIWTRATEWVSSAWAGVSDYFGQLWNNITNFFNSGIGNITATILNWSPLGLFHQVFSTVLSWFGIDIPSKFSEFGKNMIDGLVGGIRNAWEGAKEIVSGLGNGIKGWFAEKLGIHSPSRVFKGYGVNVVEGLAIGMDKAQPLATQASQNLSSAVKFEPVLNDAETLFKPLFNEKKGILETLWDDVKLGVSAVGNLLGQNQPANFSTPDFDSNAQHTAPSSPFADYQPLNRHAVVGQEGASAGHSFVVNFNPTINVNANQNQGVLDQVQQGLNLSLTEFERLLDHVIDQKMRRAY
ncbi:phage tail tape measure protein [Avibacterium paragallinarum]|uniref:Putative bacteriophage tail protein/phage tail tape measure protein, TP901 family n=1 Tax=Avibacterium paragallinarum TaxID=728 RepID=A0A377IBU8_AVIPA